MKITIDTKEDTHAEIQKVIEILTSMVTSPSQPISGMNASMNAQVPGEQPVLNDGIFSMFSDNKVESAPFADQEVPTNDASSMFSENHEEILNVPSETIIDGITKEEREEDVRVVIY